jgi:hypothetical protein
MTRLYLIGAMTLARDLLSCAVQSWRIYFPTDSSVEETGFLRLATSGFPPRRGAVGACPAFTKSDAPHTKAKIRDQNHELDGEDIGKSVLQQMTIPSETLQVRAVAPIG